MLLSGLAGR